MKLKFALRAEEPLYAALVGAGGKTTALFLLARQLTPPVLVSTSTHLGAEQAALADQHIIITADQLPHQLIKELTRPVTLASGPIGSDLRLRGLSPNQLDDLYRFTRQASISLLIEADGSRGLPLKSPAAHEPAIPPWVELVVVSAGLTGIGKPLTSDFVHRPQVFAQLGQATLGELVSIQHIAAAMMHPDGGKKNIPEKARRVALLNQADNRYLIDTAAEAAETLSKSYHAVVIAALKHPEVEVAAVHERIAGIILAAGQSSRYGQPKILLDWRGMPLIRKVALTAIAAGLSPVIVVLGAVTEPAITALHDLQVEVIMNENWPSGQSQSIRAGISALPAQTGGAIFLLGDQPQVTAGLLKALCEEHRKSLAPIIAPVVDGHRANPVLFDRVTFPHLNRLEGDRGGRALFSQFGVTQMAWFDNGLLLDIDTPQDYQKLLEMYGHDQP